jgi:hypothetical protein
MRAMNPHLLRFCVMLAVIFCGELALSVLISALTRIGEKLEKLLTRAPMLDLEVAAFTWIPWIIGAACCGWVGFAGAIIGQMLALYVWCFAHEMLHREAMRGPRIIKFINRHVGRWQNHLALWVTLIALPGFWFIRIIEIAAYWPLVVLLGFPKYKHSEWVNVSRQKFSGLVGHDLIWCLYCDWMTGVYSLGAELLRNVESFWCPIRFYDGKKCDNCKIDFPDIEHGWVSADGTMADVEKVLEQRYLQKPRTWFGHPARLTVKGKST